MLNKVTSVFKKSVSKLFCFLAITIGASFTAKAQSADSSHLRISVITCGAGEDLYSTWGHSGIRVTDTTTHSDKVYNYGTFDFEDPDFYWNFVKGKLLYYVAVESYQGFVQSYQMEERSVVEQELQLTAVEKMQLQKALEINAREENKYYKYDFLYDNCATRVRDMILSHVNGGVQMQPILPPDGKTFRELVHLYLNKNQSYWSGLGIDILLAVGFDRRATDMQSMFLPDNIYKGFDSAMANGMAFVKQRKDINIAPPVVATNNNNIITPRVVFSVLLIAFLVVYFIQKNNYSRFFRIADFTIFLLVGLLGIFLVFMWVGTDHQLCKNNMNLLWAIPFHSVAAFSVINKKTWAKRYWLLTTVFCLLLLIFWAFLPQHLNTALIPFVALLGWRSWVQYKRK